MCSQLNLKVKADILKECLGLINKRVFYLELPSEPFAHLRLLGDLFQEPPNNFENQKDIPFKNVRGYFSLVANLLDNALVKKFAAVWQRITEIRRTV